jgi:hypothetical protein
MLTVEVAVDVAVHDHDRLYDAISPGLTRLPTQGFRSGRAKPPR